MGSYQSLFRASVSHQYFTDGQWKGLTFTPTSATKRILDGVGMLTRPTANGISVLYDDAKTEVLRLYAEDSSGVLNFVFKVQVPDRNYANYTALPRRNGSEVLYLSSQPVTVADEQGLNRLSKREYVSEDDLTDMGVLIADNILGPTDQRATPDFLVGVSFNLDTEEISSREYSVHFDTRKSYWKYNLLGKMNRSQPYIVDLDNKVEFEFRGETLLLGSKPAKVFVSKEMIPVLERSNYRFQLREPGEGSAKVLIRRLPVASEARLGMELINGKREVVAESFINY